MALTRIKATDVVVTPVGTVSATNTQSAVAELDSEKLTGTSLKTVNNNSLLGSGNITITSPIRTLPCTDVGVVDITLASTIGSTPSIMYLIIDADRDLVVLTGASSVHGIIYNKTTDTYGTPVLIRNASVFYNIYMTNITIDKVLFISCVNSSTALEAVVLSLSGNSISVGTAATATLAGNINYNDKPQLITVGTSFVFSYSRDTTTSAVRSITVSGTTATIGAETALTGTSNQAAALHVISSTVFLEVHTNNTTTLYARPVTVSGTTLTLGTEASTTCTNPTVFWSISALSSGRFAIIYNNTHEYGAIVTISSTTATLSVVQLSPGQNINGLTSKIYTNQVLLSGNNGYWNVLTDSAGTAVAGTELFADYAKKVSHISSIGIIAASSSNDQQFVVNISGNNPTLTMRKNTKCTGVLPIINQYKDGTLYNTTYQQLSDSNRAFIVNKCAELIYVVSVIDGDYTAEPASPTYDVSSAINHLPSEVWLMQPKMPKTTTTIYSLAKRILT